MAKKNITNSYGGLWIGAGLMIGLVIPVIVGLVSHVLPVWLIVTGIVILLAYLIVLAVEKHPNRGKVPSYEKRMNAEIAYDPTRQEAVIRSSICTGEKVAGFRDRESGHFTEVMLIRTSEDEERFRKICGNDRIRTIY